VSGSLLNCFRLPLHVCRRCPRGCFASRTVKIFRFKTFLRSTPSIQISGEPCTHGSLPISGLLHWGPKPFEKKPRGGVRWGRGPEHSLFMDPSSPLFNTPAPRALTPLIYPLYTQNSNHSQSLQLSGRTLLRPLSGFTLFSFSFSFSSLLPCFSFVTSFLFSFFFFFLQYPLSHHSLDPLYNSVFHFLFST
jgi:hypothetical protein